MSINFSFPDFGAYQSGHSDLVATGTTQTDALPVVSRISLFVTVAPGTGAILPWLPPQTASEVHIVNKGANDLTVWPPQNGLINENMPDTAVTIIPGGSGHFVGFGNAPLGCSAQWFVMGEVGQFHGWLQDDLGNFITDDLGNRIPVT